MENTPAAKLSKEKEPSSPVVMDLPVGYITTKHPFKRFPFSESLIVPCKLPVVASSSATQEVRHEIESNRYIKQFLIISF